MFVLKCTECGNTFKLDHGKVGEIVGCPVCEANYEVQIVDGKIRLKEYIHEKEDFGELFEIGEQK